jgi:glycosyltransferase involved in cell wall biosynthesis
MTRVVHFLDTSTCGGMEQVVLTLFEHLDRSRFELVLAHHGDPGLEPLVNGAHELGVRSWAVPRMQGRAGARVFPRFVLGLRRERASIFHAHLNWPLACHYGIAGAAAAGVPAICASEHAFVEVPWRAAVTFERCLSLVVDRYLPVSQAVAARLSATFGFPARKLQVVYDGVALERFHRPRDDALRRELTGGRDVPLVLTVGRLDWQKGQRHLLDAVPAFGDVVVALAGEGPDRSVLEQRIERARLAERILLLGQRSDIPDLLGAADVVVQTSAAFEGLGLAAIEAMAAGRPVVVTNVGAAHEVVRHGESGLVVPPADPGALAAAVRSLLSNRPLAERFAEAGRARAEALFSASRMAERVTAIYERLLSRFGTRGT